MSKSSLQEMFPDLQNTKPEMVSIIMGNEKFRERVSDWLAQNNPVVKPRPSKKTKDFRKGHMKPIPVKILREITELDGTKKEIEAVVMKDKGRQEKVTEWLSKNSATTAQKKEQKSEEDEQTPAKDEQTPPKDKQTPAKDDQTPEEEEQDLEEEEQTPPKDEQTPPKDEQTPPKEEQTPAKDKQTPAKDKQTPPKDKQTPPKDEQTPPKDKQTPEKEVVSEEEEEEKESDDEQSDEENSADAEQSEEDVKCDVYEYKGVQYHCDPEKKEVYLKSELFGYAVEVFCNSDKRLPIPGHVVVKDLISDPEEGNKYTCLLSKIEVVLTNGEWIIPKKSKKKKSKKAKKPEDSEEPEE